MVRAHPPIRHAILADLDALVALEEASFSSDRIGHRQWRRYLAGNTARVLVCGSSNDLRAAAVLFFRRNTRVARLYSLAVRADQRGHGLATALLCAGEHEACERGRHSVSLEVGTDNPSATALYEHRGYQRIAHLPGYYEDGTDAWRYRKCLAATGESHRVRGTMPDVHERPTNP